MESTWYICNTFHRLCSHGWFPSRKSVIVSSICGHLAMYLCAAGKNGESFFTQFEEFLVYIHIASHNSRWLIHHNCFWNWNERSLNKLKYFTFYKVIEFFLTFPYFPFSRHFWRKYRRQRGLGNGILSDKSTDPLAAKSVTGSVDEVSGNSILISVYFPTLWGKIVEKWVKTETEREWNWT